MLRSIIVSIILILNLTVITTEGFAAPKHKAACPKLVQTSLIVDTHSRRVLHAENITHRIHPASLTKLMTLYVMFDKIESGNLSLNTKLYVSGNAEKVVPTKLGLKAGSYLTVREAILGLIVKSANDAAITVAENISGSETQFGKLMTAKAKKLGMKATVFKNASGLHHQEQKTTAVDLATLSFALKRDYPQYYHLFSKTSFEFRGETILGHNRVLASYHGAKYSKTGFTNASGFNMVTAASRGNKSLLAVVTGCSSRVVRDQKITKLLDKHFNTTTSLSVSKDKSVNLASNYKRKKSNQQG